MERTHPIVSHVSVDASGGRQLMTRDDFLSLPLSRRLRLIMDLKVQFLSCSGQILTREEAIYDLKRTAA